VVFVSFLKSFCGFLRIFGFFFSFFRNLCGFRDDDNQYRDRDDC
jgi:hypothetical protein